MKKMAVIMGFSAVALGAFGAHALRADLLVSNRMETWKTAVEYHLVHAVVLLAIAWIRPGAIWSFRIFSAGMIVFSGSLYLLCLTKQYWLGTVTPVGGLLLLAGWASLLWQQGGDQEKAS